jgi:hypothetical protein
VGEFANDLRAQAAQQQCFSIPGVNYACAATARFLGGFYDDLVDTYTKEFEKLKDSKNVLVVSTPDALFRDYLLGNSAISLFQGIMYSLQYFFATLQELILFLWALTAPVMAAYSIFPASNISGLLQWGITYISVILCQVYYVMTIAIFASLIQTAETSMLSDILFPLVLGPGAWLLAAGLAAKGATMAVHSLTNAGISTITTVGSLGALAIGGPIGGAIAGGAASGVRSATRSAGTRSAARSSRPS